MTKISGAARGLVRCAGLAAAAMLVLSAAPQQRAEALSLASPGTLPVAKYASEGMTIEVRGGHGGGHGGGGFRGGGGGFHGARIGGGGFHAARIGGGYRAAHIYRGGGYRAAHIYRGGYRFAGVHRFHRHHFHRRFYYAPSYYHYPRRCRIVWTYYGPRKICRWHRHHHWRLPYRYYW
jgi:hypothetical protein